MDSLQLTFIGIGLVSLVLLYNSIRIMIKAFRCKTIAEFPIDSDKHELKFNSTGLHSICFMGAKSISHEGSFTATLISSDGNTVSLKTTFPQTTFRKSGIYGVEYFHFEIKNNDFYTLIFSNINDLRPYNTQLFINKLIQRNSDVANLKIRIKQTISTWQRLSMVIGLVLGVNGLVWGIMIGVFNLFSQV